MRMAPVSDPQPVPGVYGPADNMEQPMARTPLQAALRWMGDRFDVEGDEMPPLLIRALGAGSLTFDMPNLAVTTPDGPVNIGPGDWIVTTQDGELGALTNEDFEENYEVTL